AELRGPEPAPPARTVEAPAPPRRAPAANPPTRRTSAAVPVPRPAERRTAQREAAPPPAPVRPQPVEVEGVEEEDLRRGPVEEEVGVRKTGRRAKKDNPFVPVLASADREEDQDEETRVYRYPPRRDGPRDTIFVVSSPQQRRSSARGGAMPRDTLFVPSPERHFSSYRSRSPWPN
ncbi:MAG TPA: hypothetical protein VFX98_01250, partial [Longimicrobiaceae bacterium]|nr:hypothetical protein [Longimicrobiaceae bacterium]